MRLTEEQEAAVREKVEIHRLKLTTLSDDILDHLCCVIESRIGEGIPFEKLLDDAIKELAPNGLNNLEMQTIFLLNYKRIIIMKRLIYIVGFMGAISLTAGVTFKLLHFPFGYELFSLGMFTLLLLFVPLMAFDRYKVAISKALSERMKIIMGVVASIITGLSVMFKVLHLQGAEILLLLGALVFALGFLPFLFFTMYKKSVS